MGNSNYATTQYNSEEFVESCGAVLFDFSDEIKKVCLIHYLAKDEWLLAKGRRNCGETRRDAALREVLEETGYQCHIFPVTMSTRAPAATEMANTVDQARCYTGVTESFMVTIRKIEGKSNAKIIWWYIAEAEQDVSAKGFSGESSFAARFFNYDDALQRLTYNEDRDVLRAISLVGNS